MVVPYEISVAEDVLIDTRERIRATRWAEPVAGDEWRYGASIPYLKDLLDYWAESYDWRTWEAKLNSQPHFMTTVDGLDLHFWHVRGKKENSIPLLLLHGWPGSVIEYFDLLGPLTDPAAHGQPDQPSFDVVLAELPGFGFGGKPAEEGWGPTRMANALDALMREKLGYEHYGIHGGDWGTLLGAKIARLHAGPVAALQVSMPMSQPHSGHTPSPEWAAHMHKTTGYLHVQNFVPDAFTLGLADSPLGTAAWVIEKFRSWSDNDGDVEKVIDRDVLLTNIQFYWLTRSIVSATRLYRESNIEGVSPVSPPQIPVPTSVLAFPKEPFSAPREWLEGVYQIEHYAEFDSGGHFAGLEKPDEVLANIRGFFPSYLGGAS